MSNMADAARRARGAYSSGVLELTPMFLVKILLFNIHFLCSPFVDSCLSFIFDLCMVFLSSIYGFWLSFDTVCVEYILKNLPERHFL